MTGVVRKVSKESFKPTQIAQAVLEIVVFGFDLPKDSFTNLMNSFTTLFTLRGDKLHINLSRMAVVMSLFVALIITQSYTASLASMLTAQRLEPSITSVEMLRNMNAPVGYCNGSFVNNYLTNVLGSENVQVKNYSSTHRYAEALNKGEIAANFLEVPAAKAFLAQYSKSFIRTGDTFKVGGFGFVLKTKSFYW